MKITIECKCGNKFTYEGRCTFDMRDNTSDLDIFMNCDDNIVFECDNCQDKIRFEPNRYPNDEITLDDAIINDMYGYNTSYDADAKEVLSINQQCGKCGNYIQETNVSMAGYFCKDCR